MLDEPGDVWYRRVGQRAAPFDPYILKVIEVEGQAPSGYVTMGAEETGK
jgi:hypothetical protein